MLSQFALISLASLISVSALAGQETWGGDTFALKFIKLGVAFTDELKNYPECQLQKYISASELDSLLKTTHVSSLKTDATDKPGSIFINRRKYNDIGHDMKKKLFLTKYLQQISKSISAEDQETVIKTCLHSKLWNKVHSPSKDESFDNNLDVSKDVKKVFAALKKTLKKRDSSLIFSSEDLKKFDDSIEDFNSKISQFKIEHLDVQVSPLSLAFRDGSTKDALNTKDQSTQSLKINRSLWRLMSLAQKQEFLLHELAGLLNIEDKNYQLSSRLMFIIDEKDYLQ